jgi:tetratricopeptide (TPR) repeat protein
MRRQTTVILLAITALCVSSGHTKPTEKKKDATPDVVAYNDGVDLMKKRRYPQAQKKFEEAVTANAKFAEAHSNLGYVLRKQGAENHDKALEHYNKAIKLNKKLAPAYAYRGALFVLMGDKDKAEADYKTLEGLDEKAAKELRRVIDSGRESSAKGKHGVVGKHGW